MNLAQNSPPRSSSTLAIGAVILGAGSSKRLGRPKQLLQLGNKPVFRYAVDCAIRTQLHPVVLVAGSHLKAMSQHVGADKVQLVYNPDFQTGMASSLKIGVQELRGQTDGVMVFLADQPLVPDSVVHDLVHTYTTHKADGCRIVRPIYGKTPGNPVLFDKELFPQLLQLTGDTGAREFIKTHQNRLWQVPYETEHWGLDIDTEEDWAAVQEVYASQSD